MIQAFIGLGSNLGNRAGYLEQARRMLAGHPVVELITASSLYETEPVGYTDQGWFLNQVVEVATGIDPHGLLRVLQGIERELGRERLIRWGPRVIDLDLLLYGGAVLTGPDLTVPHPRLYERSFVLAPLNEIAPQFIHPDGKTTLEHLQALGAGQKIKLFQPETMC
jgi:2-amino-4-hydroxy-6-hydroxymethyldihydropteridine diphosphokinase